MNNQETKLEKTKKWFANQYLIVAAVIILLALVGLSQGFKAIKDIKESSKDIFDNNQEQPQVSTENISQVFTFTGKIIDTDNQPVKNAMVEITDIIGLSVYTDNLGNFSLETSNEITSNTIELSVSHPLFENFSKLISLSSDTKNQIGKILLTKKISKKNTNSKPKQSNSKTTSKQIDIKNNTFNDNAFIGNNNVTINNITTQDSIK